MIAQKSLECMQGQNATWFAGAWTGSGFHEDGLRSAVNVANKLGCYAPWQKQPEIAETSHGSEKKLEVS